MTPKVFKPWLRWSLLLGGWLLLAPVLAGFIWSLLQTVSPQPQQTTTQAPAARQDVLWISNLDRYWQPAPAREPEPQLTQTLEPSRLRVEVQGVFFSTLPGRSVVLLKYRNQDLTLAEGDELEEKITLHEIRRDALIFNRQGQLERVALELTEEASSQAKRYLLNSEESATSSARPPARSLARDRRSAERSAQEPQVAETSQDIAHQERVGTRPLEETFGPDFRESLVRDPLQLMRHITLSPHNEGGRLQGFRIRPGSDPGLFNSLGLKTGDLVTAIDGTPVSDTSAMMQLHGQLATARSLDVEILRAGERLLFSLEME